MNSGYTLIEILVGLSIISLLFLGGYTGYQEFVRRQALENSAADIKNYLNLVRQNSLSGNSSEVCTNLGQNNTLDGYQVDFFSDSFTYQPRCKETQPGSSFIQKIDLPKSVTLSMGQFTNPLIFYTVSGTNLSSDITLTLTHTNGSTKMVTITTSGVAQ